MGLFDKFKRKRPDNGPSTPSPSTRATNEAMRQLADRIIPLTQRSGVTLDYSERSVARLERLLGEFHDFIHSPENTWTEEMIRSNARAYGAYVGELLLRRYGGEWEEGNIDQPTLVMGTVRTFPVSKVDKRLRDGPDDDVWLYYESLTRAILPAAGNPTAVKEMRENAEVFEWFRKRADAGDSESMWRLGLLYTEGQGTARDYSEAMKWFLKSAEAANRTAFNLIAWLYTDGLGVTQDFGEVFKWQRKAAEAGDTASMFAVGKMYAKGVGVEQDMEQAVKWMRNAAKDGNTDGQRWLSEHGY